MNERFDATPESKASLVDRVDNRLNFFGVDFVRVVVTGIYCRIVGESLVASWELILSPCKSYIFGALFSAS